MGGRQGCIFQNYWSGRRVEFVDSLDVGGKKREKVRMTKVSSQALGWIHQNCTFT